MERSPISATGSPQVFVVAPDGTGTMTVTPNIAITSSTGNFFTFTYTAATGGMHNGEISLLVPAVWPAPDANGFNPGGTNALCGDSPVTITGSGPWTVHVTNVTLAGGATCDIHYGINMFGTVTAPSVAALVQLHDAAAIGQHRHAHRPRIVAPDPRRHRRDRQR